MEVMELLVIRIMEILAIISFKTSNSTTLQEPFLFNFNFPIGSFYKILQ
jgi:hypothetical protein